MKRKGCKRMVIEFCTNGKDFGCSSTRLAAQCDKWGKFSFHKLSLITTRPCEFWIHK